MGSKKRLFQKFQIIITLLICIMIFPLQVHADSNGYKTETGSLTLHSKSEGKIFSLYKVADFSETGKFDNIADWVPEDVTDFESLDSEGWRVLARELAECVNSDKDILPVHQDMTDKNGQILWSGLQKGLYLVIGERIEDEEYIYTSSPSLVTIPNRTEEGVWYNTPEITVKESSVDKYEKNDITVVKIWKDAGLEDSRPKEITVQLLKDGKPYGESVKLNKDNNWQYEWKELSARYEWTVKEKDVPKGYTAAVHQDGQKWIITNTADKSTVKSTNTSGSKLPQTGQLWWPVPFLTLVGIVLYLVGWIFSKKDKKEDK